MSGILFALNEIFAFAIERAKIKSKLNVAVKLKSGDACNIEFKKDRFFIHDLGKTPLSMIKKLYSSYIYTDFHTFMRLGYNMIGHLELLKLLIKRKIKMRGIFTLLKFQRIIKKLNGK